MSEGHRAIDGIKYPPPAAGPWARAVFFAENGIGGEGMFLLFGGRVVQRPDLCR